MHEAGAGNDAEELVERLEQQFQQLEQQRRHHVDVAADDDDIDLARGSSGQP